MVAQRSKSLNEISWDRWEDGDWTRCKSGQNFQILAGIVDFSRQYRQTRAFDNFNIVVSGHGFLHHIPGMTLMVMELILNQLTRKGC